MRDLILFGAGTSGRVIARNFKDRVLAFADNDGAKWGEQMEGVLVQNPRQCAADFPEATWLASAIIPTFHAEITAEIERMGVKTLPVWGFLPQRNTPPPERAKNTLLRIASHDADTSTFLWDQIHLRNDPENYIQCPPADIKDIYFPDFITHKDDEFLIDAGAADGDTVTAFIERWPKWQMIYAIEPDRSNIKRLMEKHGDAPSFFAGNFVVSDHQGQVGFTETGDYSAHISDWSSDYYAPMSTLDSFREGWKDHPPTYIKYDIEGSEPDALWGARRILKEHKPVLAICAYHEAEHFWSIPLLIHALQPEYRLFFRRYAQGSFELIWYAVPPERVK